MMFFACLFRRPQHTVDIFVASSLFSLLRFLLLLFHSCRLHEDKRAFFGVVVRATLFPCPQQCSSVVYLDNHAARNRGLFQRLSGFETRHPAAAAVSPLPAFDFSASDEQDAVFLVSVMDCSDCDSSGLDSPNSSWSIARRKEYLRRKKMPSKREKKPSF